MDDATTTSFLTFGLGGERFAISLVRVLEIVACRTVVRVPSAAEALRGVMNLRGSVVPVLDLARRVGIGDTALSDTSCAILIETDINGDNSPLAALVQEIHGVVELGEEELAKAPEFGTPVNARLLCGITPQSRGMAYVLDLDALLAGLS